MKSILATKCYEEVFANIRPLVFTDEQYYFARQIPKMLPEVKAVICICVATFGSQEIKTVKNLLGKIKCLTMSKENYEIIFFANWPLHERSDEVLNILNENRERLPNMRIISGQPRIKSIGHVRGILHGVVAIRAQETGIDPIHITMDADTVQMSPTLIQGYIKAFRDHQTNAVVGQLDWESPDCDVSKLKGFLIGSELMRLLPRFGHKFVMETEVPVETKEELIFSRRAFGRGVQSNLAFRNSAYCEVGGYDGELHDEFDALLRKIWIKEKLDGNKEPIRFLWREDGVWVTSDARRALWSYSLELPPIRQWEVHSFGEFDAVRTTIPEIRFDSSDYNHILLQINRTLEVYNLPLKDLKRAIKFAFRDLGFIEYEMKYIPYQEDPILFQGILKKFKQK